MLIQAEKRYTTQEVAAVLGVSRRRVRAIIESGGLAAEQFGRDLAILGADLEAYKSQRKGAGRPKVV